MPRGLAVLAAICALSVVNWRNVNPFGDAADVTGWSVLCTACYVVALAWPVLLVVTIVGYATVPRAEEVTTSRSGAA